MPGTGAVHDALFHRAVQTILGKAAESLDGALQMGGLRIRRRNQVVKFLIGHFRIAGDCPVDKGLHLGVHGVEIDRRGHDKDIGFHHFIQNIGHIILLHTAVGAVTNSTAGTVPDVVVSETNHFHIVSGLLCTQGKLVA